MRYKVFTLLLFCVVATFAQNQVVRRQGTKKPTSSSTTKKQSTSTTKKQGSSKTNKKTSATTPKKTTKVGGSTTKKTNSSATKKISTTDSENSSSNSTLNQTTSQAHQVNVSYSNGVLTVNGVRYEMMMVYAGTFTMGATSEMQNPGAHHTQQVTLTNNYRMGKTEVTQALWKAVMGNNPSEIKGDNKPVECVLWDDCQEFISKLNAATGKHFRLPTEAEWEFAARGGNNSHLYQYSGSNTLDEVGWYTDNSGHTTHDVATKQPNELGIYDMSGNVWEWCSDWYGSYSSVPQVNPTGPSGGTDRAIRGGGWSGSAVYCCSSDRRFYSLERRNDIGLRLALSENATTPQMATTSGTPAAKSTTASSQQQPPHTTNASYSNGVLTYKGITYEMIKVDAGTFTMGATSETEEAYEEEKPAHKVTLANNYYLGKTEVTQALWKAVMGTSPSYFEGDNKPVECVSWDDCQEFISKLNAATGKTFRLPTEAEWEFAARGGNNSRHYKYSGSNTLKDVGWYTDNSSDTTHDVATKRPNELGLYDMSGNVWEWCSDRYGSYSSNTQYDPAGSLSGSYRVSRGGGVDCYARSCRSSMRASFVVGIRTGSIGLRLALSE